MNTKNWVKTMTTLCEICDRARSAFLGNNRDIAIKSKETAEDLLAKLNLYKTEAGIESGSTLSLCDALSSICELMLDIVDNVEKKIEKRILFSSNAVLEVSYLFTQTRSLLETTQDYINFTNSFMFDLFKENQAGFDTLYEKFVRNHQDRLAKGICLSDRATIYLNILSDMRSISMILMKIIFMEPAISESNKGIPGNLNPDISLPSRP